ncbi:MAG: cytochrome c biogenesis protein CcsA, partial [Prevotellamassilia sp.]|nr:cytochrome c biogenesis protein CcsA [Prevotellamassilia sp.]
MTWNHFPIFVILTLLPALLGAVLAWRSPRVSKSSLVCSGVAVIVFCVFVAGLWLSLGRPPLRTLGETRLWYSLFMLIAGMWVYRREGYRWMPSISLVIATVFMIVNLLKPDLHDQSLMPALRSFWFVPHVTSYIFSYSLFGCAFLLAVLGLWQRSDAYLPSADRLVRTAFIFLTFGLLSGCVWAKQAWGTYW